MGEVLVVTIGSLVAMVLLLWSMNCFIEGKLPGPVRSMLRRRHERKLSRDPAMCGCEHHLSFHGTGGAACGFLSATASYSSGQLRCGCQRFVSKANPNSALIELGERNL